MWPSSHTPNMSTISHKTVCVWRVFGWELDGTGARLSPYSPVAAGEVNWQHLAVWEPKHLYFHPHHPGAPSSLPLLWVLLPLAHTWQNQSGCKLWMKSVCVYVCVYDIPGSMEADRAGMPPAATIEPREMWADRLASWAKASRALWEGGEGGRDTEAGWKEKEHRHVISPNWISLTFLVHQRLLFDCLGLSWPKQPIPQKLKGTFICYWEGPGSHKLAWSQQTVSQYKEN